MPDIEQSLPQPWERTKGESAKAYWWFVQYREMPRSIRAIRRLAAENARSPHTLYEWSRKWGWKARSDAWDAYCEEVGRVAQLEGIRQAGLVRAQVVLAGLEAVHDRIVGRDALVDEASGEIIREQVKALDPGRLDAKDLANLGNMLAKMQGLAEEAAGLKKGDLAPPVNITLSFPMEPVEVGTEQGVITGTARVLPPSRPALDPVEEDES